MRRFAKFYLTRSHRPIFVVLFGHFAVAAKYPHWHSKDQQKFRKTLLVLVFPAASDIASFVERRARPCRRRRFPQHSRKRTLIPCPHLYDHGGQLGPHNSIG